jgi:large subunit ribosomal protein L21
MQSCLLRRTLQCSRSRSVAALYHRGSLVPIVSDRSRLLQEIASREFSTTSSTVATDTPPVPSRYAAVDHSHAYEAAMRGAHGHQLALAELEGEGKDDPPYDPFIEDELEEERQLQMQKDEDENVIDVNYKVNTPKKKNGDRGSENDEDLSDDDDDDFEDEDGDNASLDGIYNKDGSLRRTKSERAILRAGAPAGGMFAIIELPGSQYKVTTDDLLIVNRLKPLDTFKVGSIHTLKDVLLVSSSHLTCVGMPYVNGAEVDVMVEEITKGAKVIVFKKRRRKHSERKNGFRRDVTMLRILDVRPPPMYEDHVHRERPPPEPLVEN